MHGSPNNINSTNEHKLETVITNMLLREFLAPSTSYLVYYSSQYWSLYTLLCRFPATVPVEPLVTDGMHQCGVVPILLVGATTIEGPLLLYR